MARRSLAASVVVTISLAEFAMGGCDGEKTKNPPEVVDNAKPKPRGEEDISRNPPEPGADSSVPADEGTAVDGGPPPDSKADGGVRIQRRPDGTCFEVIDIKCEPGATCNPPPPRDVPCPLPKAKNLDRVSVRDNGDCYESFKTNCPEGARCNPPPPRQVECPPKMKKPE